MGEYRKPPEGKRIQKGQVLNPLGAGAQNPEMTAIRRLTQDELAELASMLVKGGMDEMESIEKDRKVSFLLGYLAACLIKGRERGDFQTLNAILDRIVGKSKDVIQHIGAIATSSPMTLEEFRALKTDFDKVF